MPEDILIQGKSFPWLVDERGRAYVLNKESYDIQINQLADGVTMYVGEAYPGNLTSAPAWRVKKIVTNAEGDLTSSWEGGSSEFDKIWDDYSVL